MTSGSTSVDALAGRCGRVVLTKADDSLVCTRLDRATAERLSRDKRAAPFLVDRLEATRVRVLPAVGGVLKQALVAAGYSAEDLAGYVSGDQLEVALRGACSCGAFEVRDYQREAADAFNRAGSERGGSGVIVLPCGAGKTTVGMAAMAAVGQTSCSSASSEENGKRREEDQ